MNGTLCPCGYARPELHNNPYSPGTYTPTGYYPGDVYDYYAVTLDPWDEALESDRSERALNDISFSSLVIIQERSLQSLESSFAARSSPLSAGILSLEGAQT